MSLKALMISLCGVAAIGAGILWLMKAGAVLVFGYQPPLVFEVAQIFFAVGVIGLYLSYKPVCRWTGRTGFYMVVHLELPIFMIGLTWIALGVIILRRADLSARM